MKIDTKPILLPDGQPPKGIDHPVAENRLTGMGLPASLKGIRWHPVASGRLHENETDYEAAERDAIQDEASYAATQTIPQELMVRGLMRQAKTSASPTYLYVRPASARGRLHGPLERHCLSATTASTTSSPITSTRTPSSSTISTTLDKSP